MKVAIVNDSLMALESLRRIILGCPKYELAWTAMNGQEALEKCAIETPDIILMDLIMPVMDGIEATRQISARHACAILVVTATVEGNAARVFEAMSVGALDAVSTPVLGTEGNAAGCDLLLRKLASIATLLKARETTQPVRRLDKMPSAQSGVPLIAIGASTGGPAALKTVLGDLPADLNAAIAVVQHVDQQFVASFADWLDQQVALPVRLAGAGDGPRRGTVLVCGREDHLICTPSGVFDYTATPRELAYRPSVDVFFHSVAENYTNQVLGILLTGMGRDGAAGLEAIRARGWHTIAQDEATSAVYGMPKAAKERGAARQILAVGDIGPAVIRWLQTNSARCAEEATG